jgi:hypothetical protein
MKKDITTLLLNHLSARFLLPLLGLCCWRSEPASPNPSIFSARPRTDRWGALDRRVLVRRSAGKIVSRFSGGRACFFDRSLAAQDDQGAREGKVGRHLLDGEGMEPTGFDPSVAGLGVGKKGVSLRESIPWACWSSLGWLPLICRRKSPSFSTMRRAVFRFQVERIGGDDFAVQSGQFFPQVHRRCLLAALRARFLIVNGQGLRSAVFLLGQGSRPRVIL